MIVPVFLFAIETHIGFHLRHSRKYMYLEGKRQHKRTPVVSQLLVSLGYQMFEPTCQLA
jgi:hypothetical protein